MYKDSIFNRYSNNLVNKYEFDDSKTTITDSISGVNGTLSSGASFIKEDDINFARFLGNSSSRAVFGNGLIPVGEKTIRFRIRINGLIGTEQTIFTNVYNGGGNYNNITVYYLNNKQIQCCFYLNGNGYNLTSNTTLEVGKWYDITIGYSGTKLCIFINGELDAEKAFIFSGESYPYLFHIGYYIDMSGYERYLNADIDYLEIYNKFIDISEPLFLLKDNLDNYYSIEDRYYNSASGNYNILSNASVENYGFILEELISERTIGTETFKPIDKFDNFKLATNKNVKVALQGRKSNKELVVASSSFVTKIAKTIDYFKVTSNINDNSYIKMAISVDEGVIWKTTTNGGATWTDLTCAIPLKEYSSLTENEKIQWNSARDEIDNKGFNITDIETIDFNTLKADTIIFAYVLYQDTYNSICDNLSLEWQFDSKGTMVKMGTGECKIALTEDKVIVTPTSNQSMMKINILNGLVDMGGGSANFESATSTDIQNILSKGW